MVPTNWNGHNVKLIMELTSSVICGMSIYTNVINSPVGINGIYAENSLL